MTVLDYASELERAAVTSADDLATVWRGSPVELSTCHCCDEHEGASCCEGGDAFVTPAVWQLNGRYVAGYLSNGNAVMFDSDGLSGLAAAIARARWAVRMCCS